MDRERQVEALHELRTYLDTLKRVFVPEDQFPRVAHFLAIIWPSLDGCDQYGMSAHKLDRVDLRKLEAVVIGSSLRSQRDNTWKPKVYGTTYSDQLRAKDAPLP